jgi:RNA polymerase sigma-70 factor (ECF subfamily)
MKEVSEGHLEQLSLLFERYQIPLYNFFYQQNYDGQLSEDLVQTVFERILKYKNSYLPNMAFRAWIYQIARNVKADHYKKQQRISDFIQPDDLEGLGNSVEVDLTLQENLEQLKRAMALLPEAHKEVLIMTRFQKMRYADVAAILQCSEGAVKVKVHRAMKQLRSLFFQN